MKYMEISEKLSKRENWTDELNYVHKTRLVLGFIIGFIIGFGLGVFLMFGIYGAEIARLQEWRVTAYCSCEKCCGEWADGYTASGHKIEWGDRHVAAPPEIPFGTMITVPGYNNGEAVKVLDRGGSIKGKRIDVYFDEHDEALRWGVKFLDIKIKL